MKSLKPQVLIVTLALPFLCGTIYLYQDRSLRLIRTRPLFDEFQKGEHNNPTSIISNVSILTVDIVDASLTTTTKTAANTTTESTKEASATMNHATGEATNMVDNNTKLAADETLNSCYFVNNIQSTRIPTNATCHRTCFDFSNRIYFSPAPDDSGAGLIDVLTTIGTLLNMAGYLCARVYVPRPTFMLTSRHNDNRPLSPNMSWSDFGDFRLWNDPQRQPALIDWDNPHNISERPDEASLLNETAGLRRVSEHTTPRQVKFDFKRMDDFSRVQQQRLKVNEKYAASQGFIWIIQSEYFHWCNFLVRMFRLQPSKRPEQAPFIFANFKFYKGGCQYAQVGLSQEQQELRRIVVEQVLEQADVPIDKTLPKPLLGYLHIRRNDASQECKTSLDYLSNYLKCSLGDAISSLSELSSRTATASPAHRRVIVMYSADDRSEAYRFMAKELIELQQQRSLDDHVINVTAVDLDQTVEQVLRKEIEMGNFPDWRLNAYYIFQLIFSIGYNQTITPFHMERRRGLDCRACDNVTSQLIQAGVFDTS